MGLRGCRIYSPETFLDEDSIATLALSILEAFLALDVCIIERIEASGTSDALAVD